MKSNPEFNKPERSEQLDHMEEAVEASVKDNADWGD